MCKWKEMVKNETEKSYTFLLPLWLLKIQNDALNALAF